MRGAGSRFFAGLCTGIAIVTPFHADGKIDWAAFSKLIEFWIKGKVEYLVVLGNTGESATVHGKEKQEVFSFLKKEVAGRLPLVAGIGGNDTNEVVKGFKEFDLSGYDAILSVSPYYNKPNQEGIFQHYKALDAATPLPIIMYNVPGRTGQSVTAETQLRIARECKNIFATKEASGNFDLINQIIKNKPDEFMVISGDDPITLHMIAAGAEGLISVVANAYPKDYSDMVRLCMVTITRQAPTIAQGVLCRCFRPNINLIVVPASRAFGSRSTLVSQRLGQTSPYSSHEQRCTAPDARGIRAMSLRMARDRLVSGTASTELL